jgi:hypothetical protein
MRRGILDSILVCSKRKNNLLQCINSMLQIISNIAVNSLEEAKNLLNHNVFGEFVISHAKETHNVVRDKLYRKNIKRLFMCLLHWLHLRIFRLRRY